jgi:cytidylate kinase
VRVWTISALEGTGGEQVAAELATVAGVPLFDRDTLVSLANSIDPGLRNVEGFEEIEQRVGGRLNALALSMAMTSPPSAAAALQESQFRETLPELIRKTVVAAAHQPCVILAPAAFAALGEHPAATHVQLRAPRAWRIDAYQREHLVDRDSAEKAVKHDEHVKRGWLRSLYHVDLDDIRAFNIVLDTSRFSPERLVEILLAAGGLLALPTPNGDDAIRRHGKNRSDCADLD